jgi:predicted N-acyltransferase
LYGGITIKVLRLELDDPRWSDFVNSCVDTFPYHQVAWSQLLAECYSYDPFVVAVVNADGDIVAGMPLMQVSSRLTGRRWVSLPFTDYCPPLCKDSQCLDILVEYLVSQQEKQSLSRIEAKCVLPSRENVYKSSDYVRHTIDLSRKFDEVVQGFSRTHKQNTRRASREGLRVKSFACKKALDTFFSLFVETRRRHGVPVQPKRFFDLFWKHIIAKNLGFVMLVYREELPLAGGVFLNDNHALTFKYAASCGAGREHRANNLLAWHAIEIACERGYRLFDWGRTDVSNEGLRIFKDRWGSIEIPLSYSVISDRAPVAKPALAAGLMSSLLRYTPPFVCESAGKLLYRHFG